MVLVLYEDGESDNIYLEEDEEEDWRRACGFLFQDSHLQRANLHGSLVKPENNSIMEAIGLVQAYLRVFLGTPKNKKSGSTAL